MVQKLNPENLDDFEYLLHQYIKHIEDSSLTVEDIKERLQTGLSNGSSYIIGEYSGIGEGLGILVHDPRSNYISFILADYNYKVEKKLLDFIIKEFSLSSSTLIFESGYPTPWISKEFSDYAARCGFIKHDRLYMRLTRTDFLASPTIYPGVHLVQFADSMIEEITKMVFKSVEGTIDQDLFPFVYGTYDTTLRFHQQLHAGDFGSHKPSYSWVLKEDGEIVGACFMTARGNDTGGVMHLAITPECKQRGLGRALLIHAIRNLFEIEPGFTKIELAVTLSNPATALYESVGFKKVNNSSTYVWKQGS
jgi:ribosomal protein S18 acetylase RimI-like enzyme